MCGTPGYVAPEVLNRQPYGVKIDTWSCGVICYILICGYPPFPMDMARETIKKVKSAKFRFPAKHWSHISESVKDLLRKMIVADPNERLSIDAVLKHPWFEAPTGGKPAPTMLPSKPMTMEYNSELMAAAGMEQPAGMAECTATFGSLPRSRSNLVKPRWSQKNSFVEDQCMVDAKTVITSVTTASPPMHVTLEPKEKLAKHKEGQNVFSRLCRCFRSKQNTCE